MLEDNVPEKAEGGVRGAPAAASQTEGEAPSCGCATTAPAEVSASACCAPAALVTPSR